MFIVFKEFQKACKIFNLMTKLKCLMIGQKNQIKFLNAVFCSIHILHCSDLILWKYVGFLLLAYLVTTINLIDLLEIHKLINPWFVVLFNVVHLYRLDHHLQTGFLEDSQIIHLYSLFLDFLQAPYFNYSFYRNFHPLLMIKDYTFRFFHHLILSLP